MARSSASGVVEQLPRLGRIAEDQATIWADTILEGGYDADGRTVIDRVEAIMGDGKLLAYRITYSESAWLVGVKGQKGKEGRVFESSFVSASLRSWLRDEQALAEFR